MKEPLVKHIESLTANQVSYETSKFSFLFRLKRESKKRLTAFY